LLSEKQNELLQRCSIGKYGIEIVINQIPDHGFKGQTVALDVEHDESGGFVGCGILVVGSNVVHYFSDLHALSSIDFSTVHAVAHNGKSDFEILNSWGINVRSEQLVWDTCLLGHIIDSSLHNYGLKDMAKRELGIEYPSYDEIVGKHKGKCKKLSDCDCIRQTLDKQPIELVSAYNAMDCYVTAQLYREQRRKQNWGGADEGTSNEMDYFNEIEKPASFVFAKMENRGISVDLDYLKILEVELEAAQLPFKAAIGEALGPINLNSPKQLLEALHAKGIKPVLKGKGSTDKRALDALRHVPLVSQLLSYSEIDTLLTSFVRSYLARGQKVVHPFFNQCGTRTGRPSCSNPNLLQIPQRTINGKLVRRMFVARLGMSMGDCDYGQIEPRVLAHLSDDPTLCDLFNDSVDFHTYTAERLGISRDRAKILNLSVGYRATFKSVAMQLKCSDKEAQNEIDKWWGLFPSLRRWQDRLIYETKRSGFCTTLLGRRIKVDGLSNGNKWQREAAERQVINNIAQGSAAEIMKRAMIDIDAGMPTIGLLVQVYDELVFEAPTADIENVRNYVVDKMRNAVILKVPLTVDSGVGPNWNEAKA